jgi:hypothetical protein
VAEEGTEVSEVELVADGEEVDGQDVGVVAQDQKGE